jgi:hypothetical protein
MGGTTICSLESSAGFFSYYFSGADQLLIAFEGKLKYGSETFVVVCSIYIHVDLDIHSFLVSF